MASSAAPTSYSSSEQSEQSSASTVLNGAVPLTPVVVAAAPTTSSVNGNNSTTPSAQPQQRPTTTPTMASGAAPQTRAAAVSPTTQSPSQGVASSHPASSVTSSPSPPTSSSAPALKPQTLTQQTTTVTTMQAQTPTQQTQRPPPPPLLHASNRAMSRSLSALPLTAIPTKTTTTNSTASRVLPSSSSSTATVAPTAAAINTTTAASTMAKPQSTTSILPTRLRPSAVATAVAAATTRLPAAPATTTAAANTTSTNSGAGRGSFASTQKPASSTPTVALSASSRLSMSTGALPLHHGNGLSVSATRTSVTVPPPPLATKPQQALRRPLQLTPSSPAPGGGMDTASPSTALHPSSVSSAAAAAAAAHLLRHGAVASNPTTKHLKPLPLTVGSANNNNSNHNHNNNTNNTLAPPVLTSISTTTTTAPVVTSSLPAVLPLHPQSAKPTSPSSASSLSSMPSSPDPPSSSGASATPSSPANTPTKAKPPTKKVKTAIQRKPVPASPKRVVQSRGQPILPRPITKGRKITGEEIQLVQGLIERCLQLYMNQTEVITALHLQANIEPSFTNLIWLKLEEQNPEFFKAYHMKLRVKEQITAFNYIVSQQAQLLQKSGVGPSFGVPAGLSTAFLPTPTPTTLSQNSISPSTQLGYTVSPVGTSSFSPLPQLASLQAFLQAAPSSFPMSLSNTVSPTPPSVTSLPSNITPTANPVSPQPVSTATQVQRTNGTSSLCSSVPTMNGTRSHIGTNGIGTNDKLNISATTPVQQPKHALSRAESTPNLVGGSKMDMEKQNEDASGGKASSVHQQNTQTLSLNGIGSTSSSTSSSSVQRQTTYQAMDLESKELSNANLFHMPNHHDDLPQQPHTPISAVTSSSSSSKDKVAHNTATTTATNTTTACSGSSSMEYDSPDCASLGTSPQGMAFLARGASEHISFPSSTPSTPPFNSDMNSSAIQLDSLHYSFADDLDCDFDIKKEVIYDPDDDDDEIGLFGCFVWLFGCLFGLFVWFVCWLVVWVSKLPVANSIYLSSNKIRTNSLTHRVWCGHR